MARFWRFPATIGGQILVATVVACAVNGGTAIAVGGLSPRVMITGWCCSVVSTLVFLSGFPGKRADPGKTGREADRRGMQELRSFLATRRTLHINLAVKLLTFAVEVTPPEDPERPRHLGHLADALATRYEHTGDPEDLDAAIAADVQAVATIAADSPDRGILLSDLSTSLMARFGHAGRLVDLEDAIAAAGSAVEALPAAHPGHALALTNLGGLLTARFERVGRLADIDAAVDVCRRAVEAFPVDSPHRGIAMSNLASGLRHRYEDTGDTENLDEAIEVGRAGLAATPAGHPNLAKNMNGVATALALRCRHTSQAADLDAAVDLSERALALTGARHPDRVVMLSVHGLMLRERFERSGRTADIERAVDASRSAVAALPDGHPHSAGCLSNLQLGLLDLFGHSGRIADVDAAIEAGRAAIGIVPADDPDHSRYLSNLAAAYLARFDRTGDPADLDRTIELTEQAIQATQLDHPGAADFLNNLGFALVRRFEQTGRRRDLDEAIASQRKAAGAPAASPTVRLKAAAEWGKRAIQSGEPRSALEGYAIAVGLLPRVAWHGLDRATRERQLTMWHGLAADAAAAAIAAGEPELAVELLEQGRSVLWTQALRLRGDLARLTEQAPDLVDALERVRDVLDRPAAGGSIALVRPDADQRSRLAREWDELVARARDLPGFEHFLGSIPFAEIVTSLFADCRTPAGDGPVAIVNVSRHGCHALLMDGGHPGVRVVALPTLTFEEACDQADILQTIMARATGPAGAGGALRAREADRHALLNHLEWLWDHVTSPVLDSLGYRTAAADEAEPSRMWWCPTGPLTALPLHAAGRHTRTSGRPTTRADTVAGRVVSSYTPTLAALARTRHATAHLPVRQLVVGLPQTPGQAPLPAVREELATLARYLPPPGMARHLVDGNATRQRVLAEIPQHPWLHLACHAAQVHDDPTRSAFTLADGELTIADLVDLRMDGGELAFLSACQTATGTPYIFDEAAHLAGAMLLVGYRQVIATLWTIADAPAALVAEGVYSVLAAEREAGTVPAAVALHHAVEALRATRPADPLLWAPYLHTGR